MPAFPVQLKLPAGILYIVAQTPTVQLPPARRGAGLLRPPLRARRIAPLQQRNPPRSQPPLWQQHGISGSWRQSLSLCASCGIWLEPHGGAGIHSPAHDSARRAARGHPPRRTYLLSVEIRHRRLARLAVRPALSCHLYTLVATPLVIHLLAATSASDPAVKQKTAYIQAAFLIAGLPASLFGRWATSSAAARARVDGAHLRAVHRPVRRVADVVAVDDLRFLAALGIRRRMGGGSLAAHGNWPRAWRPWIAAVLQSGVNLASSSPPPRSACCRCCRIRRPNATSS